MGYDAVEPWPGAYELDPGALRRALDDAGLRCICFHLPLEGLDREPDRYIEIAGVLGATHMVVPAVPEEERVDTTEYWLSLGGKLRRGAERAAASGVKVHWHNHAYEFEPLPDGSRPIDRIFEGAGDSVGYEIDCGWAARAGVDLVEEFNRHGQRIYSIHMKDTAPDSQQSEDGWTSVGGGTIDWKSLVAAFRKSSAVHIAAEHDNPSDWREFASNSIRFMRDLGL